MSRALKVELPKSASSDESSQSPRHGHADQGRQGLPQRGARSRGDDELVARFRKARAGGAEPNLVVSADAEALHGRVVHVIDLAKQQGIVKFAINVQSE